MPEALPISVRRTVWPWDAPPPRPTDALSRLRRKALAQAMVMAAVAAVACRRFPGHQVLPVVLSMLAGLNAILGLLAPSAFGAVDRALIRAGRLAGQGVTWLLLVPFYYLFFTPARLALAMRGKDPMHRRFPGTESSFWIDRKPAAGPDDYRKQF